MGEITENPPANKGGISRRKFLGLFAAVGWAAAARTIAPKAADTVQRVGKKVSETELKSEVLANKFDFRNKEIRSGWELNETVRNQTEELPGVKASCMWVSDVEKSFQIASGEKTDDFISGSILKIPLLYHVWMKDQMSGTHYLTPDVAQKILGKSEESRSFIMSLPENSNKDLSETTDIIKNMLRDLGFTKLDEVAGDLEISIDEYFAFLRKTDLPPVMLDAMLQTQEDDPENYGVSKVMRDNSSGHDPLYFKIGLGKTPQGEEFTSYVFMIGEDIRAVGYARGSSVKDVREQMLISAGALARYSDY